MCTIKLSTSAYESRDLYLDTLILNQRDKPFTERFILSIVEHEGIEPAIVKDALQRLVCKGLLTRSDNKYYVRSISRKQKFRCF